MKIYYSMIVWIALLAIMRIEKLPRLSKGKPIPLWGAVLAFGYIIFWAGIRSGVADTAMYIYGFDKASSSLDALAGAMESSQKAPGFAIFQVLFKHFISTDYHAFLMVIALMQGICIMQVFRKYSENFLFSTYLFVVSTNFTWMLNGIRQFIAAALLFGCTYLLIRKKWLPYLIAVVLLSTIHNTALLMIPVYWCVTGKPWKLKMWLSIAVFLLCAIFSEQFTDLLETGLTGTAYQGVTTQFMEDDGVNPLRVVVSLVPVVISFVGRKNPAMDNPVINVCVNMSVLTSGMYLVGVFTSGILIGRLPIYCELYNCILYPYLFNHVVSKRNRGLLYGACAVAYFLFFYLQMGNSYYISEITGLV